MEPSVEVFKTNVADEGTAQMVLNKLLDLYPVALINFDLEDCDRILRIESLQIENELVKQVLLSLGYHCEELDE